MIELSERDVNRTLLSLAWPAILENFLNTAVFLVDSIFVGRLGTAAFAAFGQTSMLLMTITYALSGVGVAAGAIVARNLGRRDLKTAGEAGGQGILLAAGVGISLTLLGLQYGDAVLRLLGTPEEVMADGLTYLHIVLYFSFFRMVAFVGAGVLRAAGDTRTPLWATVAMNLFNIVGDWVLIFGVGPFPAMGIAGAALATGLSFVVAAVIIFFRLFHPQAVFRVLWRDIKTVKPHLIRTIARITIPNVGEQLLFQGAYWVFLWMVTSLGTTALAAHFMAVRVESLSYMPAFGLSIAVSTLVGQSLGAKKIGMAELVVQRGILFGVGFMVFLGIVFVLAPGLFVGMFSPSPEVFPLACLCVQIAALELPGDTILMMCTAAMRGAGDTVTPLLISVFGAVLLRIGVIYLLVMVWGLGLAGVWYGTAIDWTVRGLLGYTLYRRGRWKKVEL